MVIYSHHTGTWPECLHWRSRGLQRPAFRESTGWVGWRVWGKRGGMFACLQMKSWASKWFRYIPERISRVQPENASSLSWFRRLSCNFKPSNLKISSAGSSYHKMKQSTNFTSNSSCWSSTSLHAFPSSFMPPLHKVHRRVTKPPQRPINLLSGRKCRHWETYELKWSVWWETKQSADEDVSGGASSRGVTSWRTSAPTSWRVYTCRRGEWERVRKTKTKMSAHVMIVIRNGLDLL